MWNQTFPQVFFFFFFTCKSKVPQWEMWILTCDSINDAICHMNCQQNQEMYLETTVSHALTLERWRFGEHHQPAWSSCGDGLLLFSRNLRFPTATYMHTTEGVRLCHRTIPECSGRFGKGNASCDGECKSMGTIATFKGCVLLSVR